MARCQDGKLHTPAVEERVWNDEEGIPRSRARVVKAISISLTVLALSTWICKPIARAAVSTSRKLDAVRTGSLGLTSTATRAADGTSSRSRSSRFAANSPTKKLTPVALPARPSEIGD